MNNDYFTFNHANVPGHTQDALVNYFVHGYEPGGFLSAVLRNDLVGAATKADSTNRECLAHIAIWIMNHAPYGSWGDQESINGWLRKGPYQQRFEKEYLLHLLSTEVSE